MHAEPVDALLLWDAMCAWQQGCMHALLLRDSGVADQSCGSRWVGGQLVLVTGGRINWGATVGFVTNLPYLTGSSAN